MSQEKEKALWVAQLQQMAVAAQTRLSESFIYNLPPELFMGVPYLEKNSLFKLSFVSD